MTADEFKNWRNAMGYSQAKAADALGLSKPSVENYERGTRREDDRPVAIPLIVSIACTALYHRVKPWELHPVNFSAVRAAKNAQRARITAAMTKLANSLDLESNV
jgi:DNA-binding XRE family transcriptional regulator